MATSYHNRALTFALAVDLCAQWKQENGKTVVSGDDLIKIKEWISTPGSSIFKYPTMAPLAARGLDDLIAENHRAGSHGSALPGI